MKLLFFDIDGVLNHEKWYVKTRKINKKDEGNIDPNCLKYLNEIIEKTGCFLIMSSSWRTDYTNSCEELYEKGLKKGSIIGHTPCFTYCCQDDDICESITRGNEILSFLQKSKLEIESYAIIDDDTDMLLSQKDYFLKINRFNGFTYKNALKIIKILNNNTEKIKLKY